jgi:hypothetical protein
VASVIEYDLQFPTALWFLRPLLWICGSSREQNWLACFILKVIVASESEVLGRLSASDQGATALFVARAAQGMKPWPPVLSSFCGKSGERIWPMAVVAAEAVASVQELRRAGEGEVLAWLYRLPERDGVGNIPMPNLRQWSATSGAEGFEL